MKLSQLGWLLGSLFLLRANSLMGITVDFDASSDFDLFTLNSGAYSYGAVGVGGTGGLAPANLTSGGFSMVANSANLSLAQPDSQLLTSLDFRFNATTSLQPGGSVAAFVVQLRLYDLPFPHGAEHYGLIGLELEQAGGTAPIAYSLSVGQFAGLLGSGTSRTINPLVDGQWYRLSALVNSDTAGTHYDLSLFGLGTTGLVSPTLLANHQLLLSANALRGNSITPGISLINRNGGGTYAIDNFAAVPEPRSAILAIAALVFLFAGAGRSFFS